MFHEANEDSRPLFATWSITGILSHAAISPTQLPKGMEKMIDWNCRRIRLMRWLLKQEFILEWEQLRESLSSPALRSSYIFFLMVPIAATALAKLPDSVAIPFFQQKFDVAIGLPFSWKLLFFASCFGSLAGSLFAIKCPRLIKRYTSFPEYQKSSRGSEALRRTVYESLPYGADVKVDGRGGMERNFKVQFSNFAAILGDKRTQEQINDFENSLQTNALNSELFYFVFDASNRCRPIWRALATTTISIAYLCFALVACQSVYTVASIAFRK